jgi:hypothetical protein
MALLISATTNRPVRSHLCGIAGGCDGIKLVIQSGVTAKRSTETIRVAGSGNMTREIMTIY